MIVDHNKLRLFKRPEMKISDCLESEIAEAYEDDEFYYVLLKTSDPYANANYVINKKDHSISWTHFTDLIAANVFDATKVSPAELRRALT